MYDIDHYGQQCVMVQVVRNLILTPELCRAARGYLDWTQVDLAGHSGVSRSTIRDYEGSRHEAHRATEAQLRLALERGGVVFLELEDGMLGVCGKASRTVSI